MGFENPTPFSACSCAYLTSLFSSSRNRRSQSFENPTPFYLCSFLCMFNQFVFILPGQEVPGFRKPDTLLSMLVLVHVQSVCFHPPRTGGPRVSKTRHPSIYARSCACSISLFSSSQDRRSQGFENPTPFYLCSFLCMFNQFVFILPGQEVPGFRKPDTLLSMLVLVHVQSVCFHPPRTGGPWVSKTRHPSLLVLIVQYH